jgi:hypothetical protein
MEECSVVIMKRFRSNWFEKTKGRYVTYNTRQSVLRRKRIYASFVKSKIPKIFEVAYRDNSKLRDQLENQKQPNRNLRKNLQESNKLKRTNNQTHRKLKLESFLGILEPETTIHKEKRSK